MHIALSARNRLRIIPIAVLVAAIIMTATVRADIPPPRTTAASASISAGIAPVGAAAVSSAEGTPVPLPSRRDASASGADVSPPTTPVGQSAIPKPRSSPTPTETPAATATRTPTVTPQPGRMFILGVDPGNPNDVSKVGLIDQYTTLVGVAPRVVNYYLSWPDSGPFSPQLADAIVQRGAAPMLSWLSSDWRYGANQPAYSNANITSGAYDAYIDAFAHGVANWGKPFYLRLDDEMNGNWDAWSPGQNGNTVASFVAMWRHVHDRFVSAGARNVRWIWTPNVTSQGAASDFTGMYPGDNYVDIVGLDGYNWGTSNSIGWQSFTQIFAKDYATLGRIAPAKPVWIGETGASATGGDKGAWFLRTFLTEIPQSFPRIQAVIYFDEDKTADGEANWLVNAPASALAAWQQVATDSRWQGHTPS
jgi:beta-mannanase